MLRFAGHEHFRLRMVLSTISGKAIRIDGIRADDESPGLRDYEASLLRLLEKLTNGCAVEINETGTSLRYKPGVIICGAGLSHDCPNSRAMGYFLEPLLLLAVFAKKPLAITLRGVTNDARDPSVDTFRTVTLPLLRKVAGIESGLELNVVRRGAAPGGGGEVELRVPLVKALPGVAMKDEGLVRRIRGIAFSMKVSPQAANRMVDAARGVLNSLLADVYIFTDATSGKQAGASPGYGIALVAETTQGCLISAEAAAAQPPPAGGMSGGGAAGRRGDAGGAGAKRKRDLFGDDGDGRGDADEAAAAEHLMVPEDVGRAAAMQLLEEVSRGGVVDGTHQGLLLCLAALGPQHINQVRLGPLTPYAVHALRHIRDFLGVKFDLRAERASGTIFCSCIGAGVQNMARRVT